MPRIIVALALSSLVLASCKTEARKRAEIRNCSAISFDAPGIARCLVAQYRWKQSAAAVAGQARQHELDSIATVQRDSLWRIDAARHREELSRCAAAGGDVSRCLQENFAWDPDRAGATFGGRPSTRCGAPRERSTSPSSRPARASARRALGRA